MPANIEEEYVVPGSSLSSKLIASLTASVAAWHGLHASAQTPSTYPVAPIRLVVPYPPGGGADTIMRLLASRMGDVLGQQVLIDNRPGAGTNIGAEFVARAKPDGYTLFMLSTANAVNPTLYPRLNYDPARDFAFVGNIAKSPGIVLAHPSLPTKGVNGLIALAKAKPGQLRYASAALGSPSHLTGQLFTSAVGVKWTHVPYKGAGPALNDCTGGHIEICFLSTASVVPHVTSKRLRALGIANMKRIAALPDVQTLDEQGVKAFETSSWYGIVVPAATPEDVIARLHAAITTALADPKIRTWADQNGTEIIGDSPQAFRKFFAGELTKWGKAVKESGAKVE